MRRFIDYKKNTVLTAVIVCLALSACGKQIDDGMAEQIVLDEPVGVVADYEYVIERNMYQADVYSSCVSPTVVEYAFDEDQTFEKYGATPGATILPGDTLAYSQTKSLDRQIVEKQEEITDFELDHIAEMDAFNKDIYDAKKREFEASTSVMDMLQFEPDEINQKRAYDAWAAVYMLPDGIYKRAIQSRVRLEEAQKECEELFNLERDYKVSSLERIQSKITDASIISDVEGDVVACNYFIDGDWIPKDTPVVAVGDVSSRILKIEYVSKGNINKALDIYAVIDGKRYEIEYVNMDPEEYTQITERGETAYTTFNLIDPDNTVQVGQYAAIVIVKDRRTAVPCVPNDSLKKESDGYYVHLFDGTDTRYVPVEIGMRDGMYAEVLSGLSVGDMVLSGQAVKKSSSTAVVERGDFEVTAEIGGYLYYPFSEWLTNPVENGDTYVKEICVTNYEKITKDQTIAYIETIPNQIEIDRLSRQISRLETRLAKMQAQKYDYDARNIIDRDLEKSISNNIRQTAKYTRQRDKLTRYSGIIEIKAPYDGIILDSELVKEGDLLNYDSPILQIANDAMSYIILRDDKKQLNYGNKAEVKISSGGSNMSIEGKVATVNSMSLSKKMESEFALISIPQEEAAGLAGSSMGTSGRWDRSSFKVSVVTRSMKNVILVPKTAVISKDKSTYVKVLKDDGSVELVSFIPGGSDNNHYWVVDGLTEGMTICLE